MMLPLLLRGIAIGFVVAAPIGPVNIAVIRRGLASGFGPAMMVGLGAALADAIYVVAIFLGLTPWLTGSTVFQVLFWVLGGAFLVYLGITGLRPGKWLDDLAQGQATRERVHPFFTGLGITLFNPMTVVSWLVVAGAFLSTIALAEQGADGAFFVGGVFAGSLLWSATVSGLVHFTRRVASMRVLTVASAVASLALIGFGLAFLLQAVQAVWS